MGSSETDIKFFDVSRFNIIMFDQRGAGKSHPLACMEDNTSQQLIDDIEKLKNHLGIKQWLVFGSSWGSLLALIYGQQYPESCLGFILSGIFLGRPQDIRLFGDETEVPEAYNEFIQYFPKEESSDLFSATYTRIMNPDQNIHMPIAKAWLKYHIIRTSNPVPSAQKLEMILNNDNYCLSIARSVLYYGRHKLFLKPNEVIEEMHKISDIPGILIHGQLDINCLPEQAVILHNNWENSSLKVLESAAHSYNDIMTAALIEATNQFAEKLQ